ncbi:MAG: molecular chaperone DnaJ [Planctomycetes bacterium]|nr:molecular chaperone DnaJ [Planctomycetota bacterium]
MAKRDYYEVLGVKKDASEQDIKNAYRRLAKQYHPDRNKGDKSAEQRFKEISEAYEVVGSKDKRQQYDRFRAYGDMGGGGFQDLFSGARTAGKTTFTYDDLGDLGDLFARFFSRDIGFRQQHFGPEQGEDLYYKVRVPFDKAVEGGAMTVSVPADEPCSSCGGSGAKPGARAQACPSCGGRGTLQTAQGAFAFSRPCPQCLGHGRIATERCGACGGAGHAKRTRRLEVKLPRGVQDGHKLRLAGQGERGTGGGPNGDLFLEISVMAHDTFKRKGNDVYSDVLISMVQAALGTEVDAETLEGDVRVKVPPGTQPGSALRLRGQGIQAADGTKGDHYVVVNVEIPKNLTERQKELLRQFEKG